MNKKTLFVLFAAFMMSIFLAGCGDDQDTTEEKGTLSGEVSIVAIEGAATETLDSLGSDYDIRTYDDLMSLEAEIAGGDFDAAIVSSNTAAQLYEKTESCVFTSATLSTAGNFEYFKARLGLSTGPEPTEVILDSPFDFSSQTLLYIPQSIPEPASENFAEVMSRNVFEILKASKGRAFVLFTS